MEHWVTDYRRYVARDPWRWKMYSSMRNSIIHLLSLFRSIDRTSGWIRFPSYHHVFDDERKGFAEQLEYMSRCGDFLSLDQAVALLVSGDSIGGRYFCVTFDDGFKNCYTNALPILLDKKVPAAFFLPVQYVDYAEQKNYEMVQRFFREVGLPPVELLDWEDCRQLVAAGMTIGSHSWSHSNLIELEHCRVVWELKKSREKIEQELQAPCLHFCCPRGVPRIHFNPQRDPAISKAVGYSSFLTSQRGPMRQGESPYSIRRDFLFAHQGDYQLRYFLSAE